MAQINIMSKLLKSKFLLGTLLVAVLVVGGMAVATKVNAQQAIVPASDIQYAATVQSGSSGEAALIWQRFLNGYSSANLVQDGKFGPLSVNAAKIWQASRNLAADGILGAMSRASAIAQIGSGVINPVGTTFPAGCSSASGFSTITGDPCTTVSTLPAGCMPGYMFSPTTGAKCDGTTGGGSTELTGGAGTVSDYKLLSSPANNREVGEDEEDVKVLGMSIEAEGSDLKVTAMKLIFNDVGAGSDFEDYASEVSVWYGSTEVARVDGDVFNDDNDWTKTLSLSSAIVKDGEVGKFYVAVSGVSNIDSADLGDTWTVDVDSVRYMDAQGALISEDPGLAVRTFSFESLATASNLELKLTESSSNPDAQVVEVDDTNATDNVELLKTNLKANGGDIYVREMTVTIDATGTGEVDEIASSYTLVFDGEEFSLDASDCDDGTCTTSETYTFDDIDMTIDAGDTVTVQVLANVMGTDEYVEGDSLTATIDNDDTVAEDSSGEDLGVSDLTGVVVGEEQAFYSTGIMLDFVSATGVKTAASDPAANNDMVTFTLKFKATAFGADAYVDGTLTEDGDGTYAVGSGINFYVVDGSGVASTNTSTPVLTVSGATSAANTTWKVTDGTTATFTLTVVTEADLATEFAQLSLSAVTWDTTAIAGTTQVYTFNLDDFETDPVYIVNNI